MRQLESDNADLKMELQTTNAKIEDYIREVTQQLHSAEQWLSQHVDAEPWLSEDDQYQQALLQYATAKPLKASTGGSSKLRTRPN